MNLNPKLPAMSAAKSPVDGSLIFVKQGTNGYFVPHQIGVEPDVDPDVWNEANDITKAEAEAMLVGSMFGWDCKGADPDNYDADGKLKPGVRAGLM